VNWRVRKPGRVTIAVDFKATDSVYPSADVLSTFRLLSIFCNIRIDL
jgi:hypothetical protein